LDNDHSYVRLVVNTSRSFPHSWFITGFVTRFKRRVPLVEQERVTLRECLSLPSVFSGEALEYRIIWEIYTLYAGAAGMLLHIHVWNIVSPERYILSMQVLLECCYIYMEYISLSWFDIPELVVPIEISLIESSC
jgi:hypothetical protein